MHLLNARTLKLESFIDSEIPEYAILSHTWGEQEVQFSDVEHVHARMMAGYAKIKGACRQALQDGYDHIWVDTCCIDKSSSAELSEAINSMFRFYREAEVCYVYLKDIPNGVDLNDLESAFRESKWFRRGWTLQELIAPANVNFYNRDWAYIGSKHNLLQALSSVTKIPKKVLAIPTELWHTSVAQRMSWASDRETTRTEDIAYCLLGIFSVNIPLLYGEGSRAFTRLQEAIIQIRDDQSIFAWESPLPLERLFGPALAKSPAEFRHSANIIPIPTTSHNPFVMNQKGLNITLLLLPNPDPKVEIVTALLECQCEHDFSGLIGFHLIQSGGPNTYARIHLRGEFNSLGKLIHVSLEEAANAQRQSICISNDMYTYFRRPKNGSYCVVKYNALQKLGYRIHCVGCGGNIKWEEKAQTVRILESGSANGHCVLLVYKPNTLSGFVIKLCFKGRYTKTRFGIIDCMFASESEGRTMDKWVEEISKTVPASRQNWDTTLRRSNISLKETSPGQGNFVLHVEASISREKILNQEVSVLEISAQHEGSRYLVTKSLF